MTVAERAILRIREEMTARNMSQRDVAERLKCSQGRVAKMLKNRVNLRVDDLAILAEAVGLALSETIRDRGLEFFAEMTPIELRVLESYRALPQDMRHAIIAFLRIRNIPGETPTEHVTPAPKRRKVGRPRNSEVRAK